MTAAIISTDLQLQKLKDPLNGYTDYKIKGRSGLTVRVAKRSKSFRARATCPDTGKRRVITLGDSNKGDTISDASLKLEDLKRNGLRPKASDSLTLADVLPDYYETQVRHLKRPEVVHDIFDRLITPFLGKTPLCTIETYSITKEIERIKKDNGHEPSRKTLAYLCKLLRWCAATGRIKQDPAASLSADLFNFKKSEKNRYLTRHEIPLFLEAIERSNLDQRTKIGLRILMLTGARSCELLAAKWNNVNISKETWYIPAKDTKNGDAITLPLAKQTAVLFEQLKNITEKNSPLVLGGMSRAFNKALTRLQTPNSKGISALPLTERITVHDLRRTLSTHLNGMGVQPHLVEKMLNHRLSGVAAIYNRAELLAERKEAACLYANAIEDPINLLPGEEVEQ